jgi:hypothetical protein
MNLLPLSMPKMLSNDHQAALAAHRKRVQDAAEAKDLSAVVGAAKELAESTARIVLSVRGEILPDDAKFSNLVHRAHVALDRQPGEGLAAEDDQIRDMAQGLKKLVTPLAPLRNQVGTGHGRSVVPLVIEEQARVAIHASWLWSDWCMNRLPSFILGDPAALIERLQGQTFYSGDLAEQLDAINFATLDSETQRAIGAAVGRRTANGTFVVGRDGVDRVVDGINRYTMHYRAGVLRGLLMDESGMLSTTTYAVATAVRLINTEADPASATTGVVAAVVGSGWRKIHGYGQPTEGEVVKAAIDAAGQLPESARQPWLSFWDSRGY